MRMTILGPRPIVQAPSNNNNIPARGRKNINIEQQQHFRLRAEESYRQPYRVTGIVKEIIKRYN